MASITSIRGIDYRRLAVDVARLLHRFYSYKELFSMTGIPPSMMSRYLRGKSIPGDQLSMKIINTLVENNEVKLRLSRLIQDDPDTLYNTIVSNSIFLLVINNFLKYIINSNIIIAFNEPTISLAIKISETFNKELLILYFAPVIPFIHAECFSISEDTMVLFVCTKPRTNRTRNMAAIMVFPLLLDTAKAGEITDRVREALKIRELIPLAIICRRGKKDPRLKCLIEER